MTVMCAATGGQGSVTKQGIGASCATHPCAYTPVSRGTTLSKSNINPGIYMHIIISGFQVPNAGPNRCGNHYNFEGSFI